ncbi:peroxisomal biogenesis factor 11-domain-containing protein [Blyttiomyces helicus]|uniref:Peroxisomal biogenesis factor 11-domain-containing protein n=1 Tax=Blyttiomyces helicus TaxID=388810 RepID=A0A4P9WI35_9FUNG|nr:peroxisomal biogenesis factor 11-domain-containing protein [Blyttiomyces helicus]|eukprot:RKO92519.1 peroxisomal biogenesis factor 11-domain-containing protein [Blyttiomyces helicus]
MDVLSTATVLTSPASVAVGATGFQSPSPRTPTPTLASVASAPSAKSSTPVVPSAKSPSAPVPAPPSIAARISLKLLLQLLVIRRILLLTDGRDKLMKITQYSLKVILWARLLSKETHPVATPRAEKTVSHLSLTRKIIRLAQWTDQVSELKEILDEATAGETDIRTLRNFLGIFNSTLGLANGFADDIICYGKMGLIEKNSMWVKRATPLADQLWYVTILLDFYENRMSARDQARKIVKLKSLKDAPAKDLKKACDAAKMLNLNVVKLAADFTFCTIDVFFLEDRWGLSPGWQACTGLLSGSIGTYKLWKKHQ